MNFPFVSVAAILVTIAIGGLAQATQSDPAHEQVIPRSGQVEVPGASLHFEELGQGPTMILLHGGGLTHRMWSSFATEAARNYRVISLDSRGHGQSTNPSGRYSYERMADDVASFVAMRGIERPIVVGYSDGGMIALTLAVRHPALPEAIAVIGASHRFAASPHYFDGMQAFYRTRSIGRLSSADLRRITNEMPDFAARMAQMHNDWRKLLTQIWPMWTTRRVIPPASLARVQVPVLVMVGDRDQFVSVPDAYGLSTQLRCSELAVMPDASHTMFRDKPAEFAQVVLQFADQASQAAEACVIEQNKGPRRAIARQPHHSIRAR